MESAKKIEVKRLWKEETPKYIFKYYLPMNLKRTLTVEDVSAIYYDLNQLISDEEIPSQYEYDDYIICFTDTHCERKLDKSLVGEIVKACRAYMNDDRKQPTAEEIRAALEMNKRLVALEKDILKECLSLNTTLQKRIADKDAFLSDYEIDYTIDFYISEDDPFYDERCPTNENEILYRTGGHFFKGGDVYSTDYDGIGSDYNWTEVLDPLDPIRKEKHCWLFHQLYGHSALPVKDIIRIDQIWTDIKVCYQNDIRLRG